MINKVGLFAPNAAVAPVAPTASAKGATELTRDFGAYLNDALNSLSAQESEVDRLNQNFITGQSTDVHQLMIAAEKANLGLELTVQIRNKAVEAYQEIMRTQV